MTPLFVIKPRPDLRLHPVSQKEAVESEQEFYETPCGAAWNIKKMILEIWRQLRFERWRGQKRNVSPTLTSSTSPRPSSTRPSAQL